MKLLINFSFVMALLLPQFSTAEIPAPDGQESILSIDTSKNKYDYDTSLKFSQDAIDRQLGDYRFTDSEGRPRTLKDFRGKPLVLSMVYTSCYQICPMTTRHLSKVVEKARESLGKDNFAVAVVGFDTSVDTPQAMQYFANKQGIHNKNWYLLSVSADDVEALAKDTGFLYFPSVNGFDHLIQATIIDAEGKVYNQVYGQVFDTPLLIEPLKELILGQPKKDQSFLSSLGNKIKLFCTIYDPVRDGYYFDYSLFIGILIGALIIILIIVFMIKELRKHKQSGVS